MLLRTDVSEYNLADEICCIVWKGHTTVIHGRQLEDYTLAAHAADCGS